MTREGRSAIDSTPPMPIAIVGIGCRFPGGAVTAQRYWRNLAEGRLSVCEVPADRWSIEEFYHPVPGTPGKSISKWGGFLDDIAQFEPEIFGISPREARFMDPQQRLLLEVAREALEDANWKIGDLAGSDTGVFVGISISDYGQLQGLGGFGQEVDPHAATGGALSIAANRISYCFNFHGPSIAVDTACSSSLVSVDLACRKLRNGECAVALAGGVNIMITPAPFVAFSAATMLSPEGRCKAFDATANGFVRGEGAGLVALKPLDRAEAEGDLIYAVILASDTNQDGRTSGIALPNGESQSALVESVCKQAGIDPGSIDYMEAHGTGTSVGDPIEATALGEVLGRGREDRPDCILGSVKANIGHLESGAGIAGLIKTALVLHNRQVPPHLLVSEPNPAIAFESLRLRLPLDLETIPDRGRPLLAAVNSFGFGGTNAHALLQEYQKPHETKSGASDGVFLLPLSARTETAVAELAATYADILQNETSTLADICMTASLGRTPYDQRLVAVAEDPSGMKEVLGAFAQGERRPGLAVGSVRKEPAQHLVFVFSGQGPQWWGMGRHLLEREPHFRATVERCDQVMAELGDWSLLRELMRDEEDSRINETRIAQPALFALQAGLHDLIIARGIVPDVVIGHSIGEIAAAYAAGVYSLEEAAQLAFIRGDSMDRASSRGRMLATNLRAREASELITELGLDISLAALNGPRWTVLAGPSEAMRQMGDLLDDREIFTRWLKVDYAFHSSLMAPVEEEILARLTDLEGRPAQRIWVSSVTAGKLTGTEADADYWWRNVRESVNFLQAYQSVLDMGSTCTVELAPHPVLTNPMMETLEELGRDDPVITTLRRSENDRVELGRMIGQLWISGLDLDWRPFRQGGAEMTRLPAYPWQRETYWNESEDVRQRRTGNPSHPLLGRRQPSSKPTWRQRLDCRVLTYLADHQVNNLVVFPAAGFLEMMLAVSGETTPEATAVLEDVRFRTVLHLPKAAEGPLVEIRHDPETGLVEIFSGGADGADWVLHASGYVRTSEQTASDPPIDPANLPDDDPQRTSDELYQLYDSVGIQYGPAFRGVRALETVDGTIVGKVRLPDVLKGGAAPYHAHPALLDACFQLIGGLLDRRNLKRYLPIMVGRIRHYAPLTEETWTEVHLLRQTPEVMSVDLRLYDATGRLLTAFERFQLQETGAEKGSDLEQLLYRVVWYDSPLLGAPEDTALPPLNETEIQAALEDDERPLFNLDVGSGSLESMVEANVRAHRDLDRIALAYFWQALRDLGLPLDEGRFDDEAVAALPVVALYRRLLDRILAALTRAGHLSPTTDPDGWIVMAPPDIQDIPATWRDGLLRHPSYLGEFTLLGRFGRQIAKTMTGETDPVREMFPDGSMTLAEQVYQDSPSFYLFNRGIAKIVEHVIRHLPDGRRLRVLEVGGGTGGLSSHVVPLLPDHRCTYVFTDISRIFFPGVERKLRGYDFVEFKTLDIEDDPLEQDFEPRSFDLVLASDVLHATRDLRKSLANIRALMRPDGLFAFLEVDRDAPFMDCVFGLMKGWWRFEDHDLRPSYPLLDKTQWLKLLREEGFEDVRGYGSEVEAMQLVLWGRAPGSTGTLPAESAQPLEESAPEAVWIILEDQLGLGGALAELLKSQGHRCLLLRPGLERRSIDSGRGEIRPGEPEDFLHILQSVSGPIAGIVHLWSLDADSLERGLEGIEDATVTGPLSIMHCVQAMEELENRPSGYRFLLVTSGAQCLPGEGADNLVLQAASLGAGRVLVNEMQDIDGKLLDLPPDVDSSYAELVLRELFADDAEDEVAIRSRARWVPRLERDARAERPARELSTDQGFRLTAMQPGVLDRLAFLEARRPEPGPGEIEIEVRAAALNFRDVLKTLDLYPKDSPDVSLLGDECAGFVTRIGDGVGEFEPGDSVVAFAAGSLASHVVVPAAAAMRKAPHLDMRAAATMPVAFLTAWYALLQVGRLEADESVLVHSATGGVGMAALQVAADAGARVLTTAGTAEKRDFLELYGIDGAMDSRSLEFAEETMAATGGQGVDLILNALSGRAIAKGLACLAPYGRFLEIGKRDIYQDSLIGLWPFHKNITLSAIDLGDALSGRRGGLRRMVGTLTEAMASSRLRPLPYRCFPASRIHDAMRHMSQGKHIGKVVVAMKDRQAPIRLPVNRHLHFESKASYLITGGFGGLGLALADWIAERGGGTLVLASRSGAADDAAREKIEALREAGIRVVEAKVDVSDRQAVRDLMIDIRSGMPPLRGVFHAAMVLDDCSLLQLTPERFHRVTSPKMAGAWLLHEATLDENLDHFVLFSSMSSIIGHMGQANYAAANSMLDALAQFRRARGLTALVMNFGAIQDVGILTRSDRYAALIEHSGITSDQALDALAVLSNRAVVQRGILRADWKALAAANPSGRVLSRIRGLVEEAADQSNDGGDGEFRAALMRAPEAERLSMLSDYLRELVGRVIGMSGGKIAEDQALNELGLDSLMALEMRTRVEGDLSITLPLAKLMQGPITLASLTQIVMEQVLSGEGRALNDGGAAAATSAGALPMNDERLVRLKEGGTAAPLICFHQGGGQLDIYTEFAARLPADLPLWGIRADPQKHFTGVATMAESYLPLLHSLQDERPYRLFGFSLGGFLALETVALLEKEGQAVSFLGIVDAKPSAGAENRRTYLGNTLLEIETEIQRRFELVETTAKPLSEADALTMADGLLSSPEEERFETLLGWVRSRVPEAISMEESELSGYFSMLAEHITLAGSYEPRAVSTAIHTWNSTVRPLGVPDTDWSTYTSVTHTGRQIDTSHFQMMRSPVVEDIAREVIALLED